MEQVISKDGTRIAYERRGAGPPLVLVHGSGIDHTYWIPLIPELERHFTVYAPDRRGRGQSGDMKPYSIQREFEDVVALVDSIPERANLLGHSYGALCSLEAALVTTNINRLALYEPPVYTTIDIPYPNDAPDRYNGYVESGEAEKALLMMYQIGGASTDELNQLRSHSSWPVRVLMAHTIPREHMSVKSYSFDPRRFIDLKIPTTFILGGDSIPFYKAATETLHAALPHSRVITLPGQMHEAVVTAPELFLKEVFGIFLGNNKSKT